MRSIVPVQYTRFFQPCQVSFLYATYCLCKRWFAGFASSLSDLCSPGCPRKLLMRIPTEMSGCWTVLPNSCHPPKLGTPKQPMGHQTSPPACGTPFSAATYTLSPNFDHIARRICFCMGGRSWSDPPCKTPSPPVWDLPCKPATTVIARRSVCCMRSTCGAVSHEKKMRQRAQKRAHTDS